jgi:signal transduction histidine kinase
LASEGQTYRQEIGKGIKFSLSACQLSTEVFLSDINDNLDYDKILGTCIKKSANLPLNQILELSFKRVLVDLLDHKLERIKLMWNMPPEVPVNMSVDSGQIKNILTTFLRHSVKYMDQGLISLYVRFV